MEKETLVESNLKKILQAVDSIKLYQASDTKGYFAEITMLNMFFTVEDSKTIDEMLEKAKNKIRQKTKE